MKSEIAGEKAEQLEGAQQGNLKSLSHSDEILLGKNLRKCLKSPCTGTPDRGSWRPPRPQPRQMASGLVPCSPVMELVPCHATLQIPSDRQPHQHPPVRWNRSLIMRGSVELTLRLGLSPSGEQGSPVSRAPNTVAVGLTSVETCCF